jgi:putative lipoic acid-binding regulatory protein
MWGEGDTYSVGALRESYPQSLDQNPSNSGNYLNDTIKFYATQSDKSQITYKWLLLDTEIKIRQRKICRAQ